MCLSVIVTGRRGCRHHRSSDHASSPRSRRVTPNGSVGSKRPSCARSRRPSEDAWGFIGKFGNLGSRPRRGVGAPRWSSRSPKGLSLEHGEWEIHAAEGCSGRCLSQLAHPERIRHSVQSGVLRFVEFSGRGQAVEGLSAGDPARHRGGIEGVLPVGQRLFRRPRCVVRNR